MVKKIYISPSDQDANVYAVGDTNEMVQCQKISSALVSALKRCGFEAMENQIDSMEDRVAESNDWGADLHVPIHTNAFNSKVMGTRIFCYNTTGEGYKAGSSIMDTLSPITPGESDNVTPNPGLYEIKYTAAPAVYIEVAFHDNAEEAQWIIDNTEEIAEAICKGICNHYEYPYIAPVVKPEGPMYRIFVDDKQKGAFRNIEYALAMVREYLKNSDDVTITVRDN